MQNWEKIKEPTFSTAGANAWLVDGGHDGRGREEGKGAEAHGGGVGLSEWSCG